MATVEKYVGQASALVGTVRFMWKTGSNEKPVRFVQKRGSNETITHLSANLQMERKLYKNRKFHSLK